jgi:hypothetical protein
MPVSGKAGIRDGFWRITASETPLLAHCIYIQLVPLLVSSLYCIQMQAFRKHWNSFGIIHKFLVGGHAAKSQSLPPPCQSLFLALDYLANQTSGRN